MAVDSSVPSVDSRFDCTAALAEKFFELVIPAALMGTDKWTPAGIHGERKFPKMNPLWGLCGVDLAEFACHGGYQRKHKNVRPEQSCCEVLRATRNCEI